MTRNARVRQQFTAVAWSFVFVCAGCMPEEGGVGDQPTRALAADGQYISWREHLIDDPGVSDVAISGADGLVMGDVNGDGHEDIVSVHESDTIYDGQGDGHVRLAFGTGDPDRWVNVTLVEGSAAASPEDVDIADFNGDGLLDVVVASELSRLSYLQNPGGPHPGGDWPRLVLPGTLNAGAWLRVSTADLNDDGTPEAIAVNKGAQNPALDESGTATAISIFYVDGDPLHSASWSEQSLGTYQVPHNAQPVDLDGDGDIDIVGGIRRERRLVLFENVDRGGRTFVEHPVQLTRVQAHGLHMAFADMNGDERPDIVATAREPGSRPGLAWFEQPDHWSDSWKAHQIGTFWPDRMVGIALADINGDGHLDVLCGGYSEGPRDVDGDLGPDRRLGRLGWFQNPGTIDRTWIRHDISRRKRGMFDEFIPRDMDGDGDVDFVGTRGNSAPFDGVFWLEQVRTREPQSAFARARREDSPEMPLGS